MEAATDNKPRKANGQFAKKQLGYRKKTCLGCGRLLWLRDFGKRKKGKNHPDGYDCRCKECRRVEKRNRESYKNALRKEGLFLNSEGRAVMCKGYSTKLYWGEETVKKFIRMFPNTKNADMAIEFECSERTVVRRAREFGVDKDPEFCKQMTQRALKKAQFTNKVFGNTADLTNWIEAGKKYQFKKGQMSGAALKRHQAKLEREGKLNEETA